MQVEFTKIVIATAVGSILVVIPTFAEEVNGITQNIEVITITGIRGSLSKAINAKRFSDDIVDSISSEDIGKFPDENIAESLQRLPGISITRDKGEGKFISVRGLSPEFSPSTLNGRQLASGRTDTAAITSLSSGSSRAFAFNVLPSELVGEVKVYKSLSADLIEGGIGGLVEIKTRKPFDFDARVIGGSLEFSYDDKSGDTNPKGSLFFTDTSDDGTMGLLVSTSYSERTLREDQFWSWGWANAGIDNLDTESVDIDYPDGFFPWEDATTFVESTSERLGISAAFQYDPNDAFELNADMLYSDFDSINTENRAANRWTVNNSSPFSAYGAIVDPNTNGLISASSTSLGQPDRPYEITTSNEVHKLSTKTLALGANLAWTYNDLKIAVDLSYSKAESKSENRNVRFRGDFNIDYTRDPKADLPNYDVKGNLLDPTVYTFLDVSIQDDPVTDETQALRLDLNYNLNLGFFTSIDSGIRYSVNEKDQKNSSCNACNDVLRNKNLTLSDVPLVKLPDGGFFENESVELIRDFLVADTAGVIEQYGLEDVPFDDRISSIYNIEEKTTAGYVKLNYALDTSLPISGNFGLRVVKTKSNATGALPTKLRIESNLLLEQKGTFSTISNSYTEVLPSMTIRVEINDEVIIRSSIAKAITRPELNLMSPRFDFNLANPPTATGGNPELDPFTSWNYDISAEWYFSNIGYISAAFFYKDIEGFVANTTTLNETVAEQFFLSISRPVNASDAKIKGIELTWQQEYGFLPKPFNGLGTILNHTYIDSDTAFNSDFTPQVGQTLTGFEGLSKHTSNAVIFYEQGPFAARLAYNYRSDYLENSTYIFSSRSVDSFGQLDASVSYELNDNWEVTLESTGLNEPRLRKFDAGQKNLPSVVIDNGRRFFLGIRGKL
jgi:TonB-dependent receptor